jgi:hypothetical protein
MGFVFEELEVPEVRFWRVEEAEEAAEEAVALRSSMARCGKELGCGKVWY